METFIVIPCLNEQESLSATCTSLGFGQGADPIGRLVLVDNGSTDGTLAVMSRIQAESPPKRVLIIQEPRRGYVSARRAGISAVLERARVEHLSADETLVFQADADTVYLQGYVEAMVAASSGKRGELLEGSALSNREFNTKFSEFAQLCREVDTSTECWFAPEDEQVVVDDKVCAFLLADYCKWGEHQDDFDPVGRQVFAETTRLFIRAKRNGPAWRKRVEDAQALPSRRKLMTQGLGYFASSGFPRDAAWIAGWGEADEALRFLNSPRTMPTLLRLVRSRQRHQLALFGLLPALCNPEVAAPSEIAAIADELREASVGMSPGELLSQMLSLADDEQGAISEILGQR